MIRSAAKLFVPRTVRNWLRAPRKSVMWIADEARHLLGRDVSIEMRPGWFLSCHPAAYRCAYFAQASDPEQIEEFDFFIHSLFEGAVLFDLGAHFGLFSFAALHYGGTRAHVVAVDPSREAMRMIRIQAKRNSIPENRLSLERAAVGSHEGQTKMVTTGILSAGYYVSPQINHTARDIVTTPLISVDHLVQKYGMRPSHLKIDVEGAELQTLRGSLETLTTASAPIICLELHNKIMRESGQDPRDVLTFLREANYRIVRVCGIPTIDDASILIREVARLFATRVESADCPRVS